MRLRRARRLNAHSAANQKTEILFYDDCFHYYYHGTQPFMMPLLTSTSSPSHFTRAIATSVLLQEVHGNPYREDGPLTLMLSLLLDIHLLLWWKWCDPGRWCSTVSFCCDRRQLMRVHYYVNCRRQHLEHFFLKSYFYRGTAGNECRNRL